MIAFFCVLFVLIVLNIALLKYSSVEVENPKK